jgi:hypothetical protein
MSPRASLRSDSFFAVKSRDEPNSFILWKGPGEGLGDVGRRLRDWLGLGGVLGNLEFGALECDVFAEIITGADLRYTKEKMVLVKQPLKRNDFVYLTRLCSSLSPRNTSTHLIMSPGVGAFK